MTQEPPRPPVRATYRHGDLRRALCPSPRAFFFFAEVALLVETPRLVSVRAATYCLLAKRPRAPSGT